MIQKKNSIDSVPDEGELPFTESINVNTYRATKGDDIDMQFAEIINKNAKLSGIKIVRLDKGSY